MPEPPSHAAPTGRAGTGPARHGRPAARESPSDAVVRRRAVRHAVLPAGTVAVVAAAVTAYALASTGGVAAPRPGNLVLGSVLGGGLFLACAVIATAAHVAGTAAGNTTERYAALRRAVARNRAEVRTLVRGLEEGEALPERTDGPPPAEPGPEADTLDHLAYEIALARRTADEAITRAAAVVESRSSGSEERVEVFVNLSRRLQSLVHREIALLDDLENRVEDPDLLKSLFHLDHLTTRIRRHAENLAVLGGAVSRRHWNRPVTTTEVLRSAVAEVEQYSRVKLVPPVEGTLRGHAVADVIHLLAELVENATVFSSPQTHVVLRAQQVTAGLAIEVEDRGLGMTPAEQNRMNAVLADPDRIDVGELLKDGRIGLFVVSALARRHGIVVQLQSNIYGGLQAVLVLSRDLLGEESQLTAGPGASAAAGDPRAAETDPAPAVPSPAASAPAARVPAAPAVSAPSGGAISEQPRAVPGPRHAAPSHEPAEAAASHRQAPGQDARPDAGPDAGPPKPLPRRRPQAARAHASDGAQRTDVTHRTDGAHRPGGIPGAHGAHGADSGDGHVTGAPPIPAASGSPAPSPSPPHPGPDRDSAPVSAPVPAPVPASLSAGPPDAAAGEERPPLPRRRRQEHLAPGLRATTPAPRPADDGSGRGHDPGLMAAFQRGTSLAEDTDSYDDSHTDEGFGSTAPASGAGAAPASGVPDPAPPGRQGPSRSAPSPGADGSAAPAGDVPRPAR